MAQCTSQTPLFRKKVTGVRELLNEEIYHSYSTANEEDTVGAGEKKRVQLATDTEVLGSIPGATRFSE